MPRTGEGGFTLIELLTVMLIVALLAAIAVPTFLDQRAKAQDTEAKSAATVAAKTLEVYYLDNRTYAGVDATALVSIDASLAEARGLTVNGTADGYTLSVDSASAANGGGPFVIDHDPARTLRTCGSPGKGGCSPSGNW
jgi:type IV pilus assembly protein PilA